MFKLAVFFERKKTQLYVMLINYCFSLMVEKSNLKQQMQ